MPEFRIIVDDAQLAWLDGWANKQGISRREAARRLINEAREQDQLIAGLSGQPVDPTPPAPAEPVEDRTPEEGFLAAVREWYTPELAAEKCGLALKVVAKWLKRKTFGEQVAAARAAFIAEREHELVLIGRARMKGNATALKAFLEANHEGYGRVKGELLLRVLDPIMTKIRTAIRAECGDSQVGLEILRKILVRFEQIRAEVSDHFTD